MSRIQFDHRGFEIVPGCVRFEVWRDADLQAQAEAYYASQRLPAAEAPLAKKAIATKRDSYGMKGIRPSIRRKQA